MCIYETEKSLLGFKTSLGSTVIQYSPNKSRVNRWTVECFSCKNLYTAIGFSLVSGKSELCKPCSNIFKKYNCTSLIGLKFGRWKIVELVKNTTNCRDAYCLCQCDCKNNTTRIVKLASMTSGRSKSCGCLKIELLIKNNTEDDRKLEYYQRELSAKRKSLTRYVLKRDGYKCVICKSNKKLNAHHINGWHWCKEGRFDESNITTLCKECHKNFHSMYGTRNNTVSQFSEYYELLTKLTASDIYTFFEFYKQENNFEKEFYKNYPINNKES